MELTENQNLSADECYLPPVLPVILSLELKQQQYFSHLLWITVIYINN